MESLSPKNEINTLRSEHLTNGERPIVASVEGYGDMMAESFAATNNHLISEAKHKERVDNAEYSGNPKYQKEHGFLTFGSGNYTISPLNVKEKVSTGYLMCTGVVGVGKDKESGENISFLSHQYPQIFLPGKSLNKQFVKDLDLRLTELKEKCVHGSVDAVILGGEYYKDNKEYENEYDDSIQLLKNEISKIFGFDPVVITGPKLPQPAFGSDAESVFFDTKNRRLYISRPKTGDSTSESYLPNDIASQKNKWNNESEFH